MKDHIMPELDEIMNKLPIAIIGIYGFPLIAALLIDFGTAGVTSTGTASQSGAGPTVPSKRCHQNGDIEVAAPEHRPGRRVVRVPGRMPGRMPGRIPGVRRRGEV